MKLAVSAFALSSTLVVLPAEAAQSTVAVLTPTGSPIGGRLERNVTAMSLHAATATITVCSRDIVTRSLDDLQADSALCADGDAVQIWVRDGDHILLKDVIVAN